jgi:hypothetical protein
MHKRQLRKYSIMTRALNDHFMSADPIHLVIKAFSLTVKLSFNDQDRIFIGNHPHLPAGGIVRPAVGPAVGEHLRGSRVLIPGAKGTKTSCSRRLSDHKISGPLGTFLGNDNPTAQDRIFS